MRFQNTETTAPLLSIRLLGPFQIQLNRETLPLRHSRKEQWLLALLILRQGRVVERDWLADTLWPESTRSRVLLRDTLYDLRQTLGSQAARLRSPTKQTVQLDLEGADVDVLAFDAALLRGDTPSLEGAIGLYRGALLEGCIEDWVHPERQAREQSYLSALERLAEQAMAAGQAATAAEYLRQVIAIDALRESAHCQLMQALADQGDYAALVLAYRDLRLLLHRELHVEPSAETTALFQRFREEGRKAVVPARVVSPPSSPSAPPRILHNLPPLQTRFIGREREREEVTFLLGTSRLLTLTGSGGCGKTRLALQIASEAQEDYSDGVWLAELAALTDPALVGRTVARTLNLTEEVGKPIDQTLFDFLKERRVLLVLDNCEHLLEACATLVSALRNRCPQVTILATSRERLGIGEEQIYRVSSLTLPFLPRSSALDKGETQGVTLQTLLDSEAVQLFVERARMVQPTFALTRTNARPLAQACIRLDGIPLAIELAAVWVRSLSVEEINTRLDNCFRLLTRGSRTALPRQQTLRALIDWSYDLLTPEEQTLFARLSAFAGGWTLAAADSICAPQEGGSVFPEDVLDLLTCLIDKSLVVYVAGEESGGRYRLLETVRTYAAERLAERGEAETMRRRHRDFFLAFVEAAESKLEGAEQSEWLERLEAEHGNLRAALEWSLLEADTGEGLRLCGALSRFWMKHAHYAEGREWCARVLARGATEERTDAQMKTLNCAGGLAYIQTDYTSARAHWEETLSLQRQNGDRHGLGVSLNNLGLVANAQGDLAAAKAYFGESLPLWQEIGNRRGVASALSSLGLIASAQGDDTAARTHHEETLAIRKALKDRHGIATSLNNLGMVACAQGDPLTSRNYILEGLNLYQELGDRRGIAMSLNNLGGLACVQGDYGSARSYLVESLALWKEIGERRGMAYSLEAFADLAFRESDLLRATTLWGVAATLRAEIGSPLRLNEREQHERNIAAVRKVLGEVTFASAWVSGCAMTLDQAIAYVLDATE